MKPKLPTGCLSNCPYRSANSIENKQSQNPNNRWIQVHVCVCAWKHAHLYHEQGRLIPVTINTRQHYRDACQCTVCWWRGWHGAISTWRPLFSIRRTTDFPVEYCPSLLLLVACRSSNAFIYPRIQTCHTAVPLTIPCMMHQARPTNI